MVDNMKLAGVTGSILKGTERDVTIRNIADRLHGTALLARAAQGVQDHVAPFKAVSMYELYYYTDTQQHSLAVQAAGAVTA
jgi:hypothetical protein